MSSPVPTPPQPRAVRPARPNVGTLLLVAYRRFEAELFAALHRAGHVELRPKHGRVLANVDRGGTRATELAARAGMTKPAMGELVDELQALGYVRRTRDPRDARAKRVVPTAAGLEVATLAYRTISGIEARWARDLGERRFGTLRAALSALAIGRGGPPPRPRPSPASPRAR